MKKYSKIKKILFALCSAAAVSGDESAMFSLCEKLLPESAEIKSDHNGNILAFIGSRNSGKTLVLDAHLDQIGLRVTNICSNGFLRAAKCGGIDARVLQGSAVTVHGKRDIPAIVACTPPHLSSGREDKACTVEKLWIDTGLTDAEASELIECGDSITFCSEPKTLLNHRVSALATDNRAGAAALIRTAWLLEGAETAASTVLLFSSREEINALGAKTAAYTLDADECIAVDVSFAEQPSGGYATPGILGKGPMLCISSTLDRATAQAVMRIAEEEHIPYQIEVCAAATGTDADHISVTKSGVKTALLSIPQENMHTQAEIVDLYDIESTAQLLAAYAKRGGNCNV